MNSTVEFVADPFFLLSRLCSEPFWNVSSAWATETPEFGACVERTVLVWIPCLLLWLCGPFYLLYLRHKPIDPIQWTALIYSKLMLLSLVMVVAVVEFVWAIALGIAIVPTSDFLAPALLFITYALQVMIVMVGRVHGDRTNGLLWFYWLLVLVCGIPQLCSSITTIIHLDRELPSFLVVTFILQYFSSVLLFLSCCFSDPPSKLQQLYLTEKSCPEMHASFPSRLTFFYNLPLIWQGWRQPLTADDLWDLKPQNTAAYIFKEWQSSGDSRKPPNVKNQKNGDTTNMASSAHMTSSVHTTNSSHMTSSGQHGKVLVLRQLWRMTRWYQLVTLLYYIVFEGLRLLSPALLSKLITFMSELSQPQWQGYMYAFGLFVCIGSSSLIKNFAFKRTFTEIIRVRAALMAAVYSKALHLSASARRESTAGQIVNLMAVDAVAVGEGFLSLSTLLTAPFIIVIVFSMIWQKLGPSALAGLLVLLLIIPLNSYLMSKAKRTQYKIMKLKDKRVKMVNEIIGGIKVLKLYAWENSFAKKAKDVRNDELLLLKRLYTIQAFNSFIFNSIPIMVSLVTFATYILSSSDNILDAEKAFVSLSLFNILRMPVIQMPDMISILIQANVALKRIEKYLNANELDPMAVTADSSNHGVVKVEGGEFVWEGSESEAAWQLSDVDLSVTPGQLVAVVGAVGAGKSSLLSALLGEMKKNTGKVVIGGRVAYVSQQAWLQNASLRDNIIWGEPYDPHRYNQVISACALQPDLDMLPRGDLTEIGEKGISISGGQKQRVALARAVYTNADVFLLDDPLSAVDAHVGKHIFEQVIGPQGMLKEKTRVLVTHGMAYLPQVDHVAVMQDGQLVEQGTYSTLIEAGGNFAQFILQHISTLDEDTLEEELELYEQFQETSGGKVLLRQISRRRDSLRSASREHRSSEYHCHESKSECERRFTHIPINRSLAGSTTTIDTPCPSASLHKSFPPKLLHQISKTSSNLLNGTRNGSISSINRKNIKDQFELQYCSSKTKLDSEENVKNNQKLVQDETSETGNVSRHVYLAYWRAIGMWFTIIPFICITLAQSCNAGSNVWLSVWSSSESTNSSSSVSPEMFLAVYGAIGLGQVCLMCGGILMVMMGGLHATRLLHIHLLNSVIHLPMRFFDTNPSGRIMNRFSKDVDVVDRVLPGNCRAFNVIFTQIISTLVVIIGATPIIAVFLVPIMLVYFFIQQVFVATSRQLKRLDSVAKSPVYSHFSETLTGAIIVRAFRKQDEFFQQSLHKIEESLKANYVNLYVNRWLCVHLEGLGNVITFVAAAVGVVQRQYLSPGVLGLSVTYALNVTMILNCLIRTVCDLEANIVSVERMNEYIQLKHEAAWEIENHRPSSSWPETGTISFTKYKTRYQTGLDLVLKGITCFIHSGEKVGIVGRTGAGKSSLTLALFRIIEPTSGNIVIDDVDISLIGLHDLRGRISIIPQDPVLFSGTVRMNLDPNGTKSDADIWWALELAHLSTYVRSQPLGLQHVVDEDGSNFSVGQRQLVCLARALLRNSRILVLDEATAAVDLETDDLIQATIRAQFSHCTVLTIAHRLNTIMDSDRVLVLEQGRIAEFDTPSALLQTPNSLFYSMAKDAGLV